MRIFNRLMLLFFFLMATIAVHATSVILDGRDATVWLQQQLISGTANGANTHKVTITCNKTLYTAIVGADHKFSLTVNLDKGLNTIRAGYGKAGAMVTSQPLKLTLGYRPHPIVKPFAVVNAPEVLLNADVIENTTKHNLKYSWTASPGNPATSHIADKNSKITKVAVPNVKGTYYYDLLVTSGTDSVHYKTFVVRGNAGVHAFDMQKDHAAWIDSAVIYEITPSNFVQNASFDDITAKLAEIKTLGVNTIWLQPIYKTQVGGHGYDVTDYMALRSNLGTEQQLSTMIAAAKKLNLRVMFDFVPNHTSIDHPYAQDCIKYGKQSHYYNFYQHTNDGKPYSSLYHKDKNGFIAYFWENLVNLDYNNPEVQRWMIENCKYWLNKYDIDGYRFDAVWGINARAPEFGKKLRNELKSIKPDLLLLAEDKAADKTVFEKGFDAAYDWTADTTWISKWAWQTKHDARKNLSIFNLPDSTKRAGLLRADLFKNTGNESKTFRFLENNDVPRFIASHNLAQTKMAAGILFSLAGIPIIYNGQEIGVTNHPYSPKPIFSRDKSIRSADSSGLFNYYTKLVQLRISHPALRNGEISEIVALNKQSIVAYHKWVDNQHFIVVVNINGTPQNAQLNLQSMQATAQLTNTTYTKDLLTDKNFYFNKPNDLNLEIPMDGFSVRWLLITNN